MRRKWLKLVKCVFAPSRSKNKKSWCVWLLGGSLRLRYNRRMQPACRPCAAWLPKAGLGRGWVHVHLRDPVSELFSFVPGLERTHFLSSREGAKAGEKSREECDRPGICAFCVRCVGASVYIAFSLFLSTLKYLF